VLAQTDMPAEIIDGFRYAVALDIDGRSAQDAPHRHQFSCHETGIVEFADAERQIEAFRDDVGEFVGQDDVDDKLGMYLDEAGQMRRDMHAPERGWRRDTKCSLRLAGTAGGEGFGVLDAGKNAEHAIIKALSGFGQRDLPRRPLQQSRAKPVFQPLDPLGDDGG
jgi:hypothetical protein